jgi:hypothetical protein
MGVDMYGFAPAAAADASMEYAVRRMYGPLQQIGN